MDNIEKRFSCITDEKEKRGANVSNIPNPAKSEEQIKEYNIATPDEIAEAGDALMQRLKNKIESMPGLKQMLVVMSLLGVPNMTQAGGFWNDVGGIIEDSVNDAIEQRARSTQSDAKSKIYSNAYDMCSKIDSKTMRQICRNALPEIVDRAIEPMEGHKKQRKIVWN